MGSWPSTTALLLCVYSFLKTLFNVLKTLVVHSELAIMHLGTLVFFSTPEPRVDRCTSLWALNTSLPRNCLVPPDLALSSH